MQKIELVLVPTTAPKVEDTRGEIASGELPADYDLAKLDKETDSYLYDHKIVLTDHGSILQILTKGADGRFTVALPENAFSLTNQTVCIEIEDVGGLQLEYRLHLTDTPMNFPASSVTLRNDRNPQLVVAEVANASGNNLTRTISFIGTEDIRPSIQARVVIPPGQPTQILADNGNVVCKF